MEIIYIYIYRGVNNVDSLTLSSCISCLRRLITKFGSTSSFNITYHPKTKLKISKSSRPFYHNKTLQILQWVFQFSLPHWTPWQPFAQNGKWISSPPIDLEQSSLLLSSPIIIIIMHMASKWISTYGEET